MSIISMTFKELLMSFVFYASEALFKGQCFVDTHIPRLSSPADHVRWYFEVILNRIFGAAYNGSNDEYDDAAYLFLGDNLDHYTQRQRRIIKDLYGSNLVPGGLVRRCGELL